MLGNDLFGCDLWLSEGVPVTFHARQYLPFDYVGDLLLYGQPTFFTNMLIYYTANTFLV